LLDNPTTRSTHMDVSNEVATALDAPMGRRAAIATVSAAAGLATLAACGGKTSSSAAVAAGGSAKASTGASPTTTAASPSPTPSPSGPAALIALADVPLGGCVASNDDNFNPILVSQPTAGKVVAFTAICSHQGCLLTPAGKEFVCPCHASKFDAMTGKVLVGPATVALAAVPVHVKDGKVFGTV
jgi:Rieske Fe-S protein